MIKKIARLCAFAAAFISAAWADVTYSVNRTYFGSNSYYDSVAFPAGTVFTATVSGYGPGNGVSFSQKATSPNNYYVFVGPGTGSSESFYGTGSSSALSAETQCIIGVSATVNGSGGYCTSTLVADW